MHVAIPWEMRSRIVALKMAEQTAKVKSTPCCCMLILIPFSCKVMGLQSVHVTNRPFSRLHNYYPDHGNQSH